MLVSLPMNESCGSFNSTPEMSKLLLFSECLFTSLFKIDAISSALEPGIRATTIVGIELFVRLP